MTTPNFKIIQRALISVSNKTGVVDFCSKLHNIGIELLSTGGTFKLLKEQGVPVTEVSEYTSFPEIMDGRVKTLHPKIHGGILARSDKDKQIMSEHGIKKIDLVIVNLYPFEETIKKKNCTIEEAIENIDIGGPTMIRAAAKNFSEVAVVVNNDDYSNVLSEIEHNKGAISSNFRYELAAKAFEHTAAYEDAIANFFGKKVGNEEEYFPKTYNKQFIKSKDLRYGENPHQKAAFYKEKDFINVSVATSKQLQGKELSFNNIADTDAALETVKLFSAPSCVIVKHANPCGVSSSDTILQAYLNAYRTDPESAFGGIIAFNRTLNKETALEIINKQFVEVIVCPDIEDGAKEVLGSKKNLRLLVCGFWDDNKPNIDLKRVNGGLLIQDQDIAMITKGDLNVVTDRIPEKNEIDDLLFSWKVAKMVKSNAIIYAKDLQTIGIGAGQMSRVNSARIAAIKAEHAKLQVLNSCMASDAFFPFRDSIDNAAKLGISAVIQPGGSIRDEEVIAAANEHGMSMVFTGMRHFRH